MNSFKKIADWINQRLNNILLKRNERKWGLYPFPPKIKIVWLFAFIDQLNNGGHHHTQLVKTPKEKIMNVNSIIVTNMYENISYESIIHTLNHEALHVAIHTALLNAPDIFIEKVINLWLMEEEGVRNRYNGNYGIAYTQNTKREKER